MKIPENCMPVVEILRRDVPKPTNKLSDPLDGKFPSVRFLNGERKCPMGLHGTAIIGTPVCSFRPGPLLDLADMPLPTPTGEFADWWDSLTLEEAKEAVDLIWPSDGWHPCVCVKPVEWCPVCKPKDGF